MPDLTINDETRLAPALARDRLGRSLRDLRISLTDRCNFRCGYCMPRHLFGADHRFLPNRELLDFAEIERLARLFAQLGVRKIRLTGGEPLLRADIESLIERLAAVEAIEDISLTTNGVLLDGERARQLAAAGLKRITVSLDAIDDSSFRRANGVGYPVAPVLRAIEHARAAGLTPVKVNMVVQKGLNEDQILPMAEYFRHSGVILRFIEFMDVGNANGWRLADVIPAATILEQIHQRWPVRALPPGQPGETAKRWQYQDGGGEIGLIASVTQAFCGGCTRARLSAKGELFTCLFAQHGQDLRAPLRGGHSDEQLLQAITGRWQGRDDRYSELRSQQSNDRPKVEMSYIGG